MKTVTTKVVRVTSKTTKPDGTTVETIETTTSNLTPEEADAEFKKAGIDLTATDEVFKEMEDSLNETFKDFRPFRFGHLFGFGSGRKSS